MAHNLLSLSSRPRKTNNVVLVQTQRPGLQEDGYNITQYNPKSWKQGVLMSKGKNKKYKQGIGKKEVKLFYS